MKQGTLNSRIIILLLMAAIVIYLAVTAWKSFRDPFTTVVSYAYSVDESIEATGFLVREEQVIAASGGVVDLLLQEGEKAAKGQAVALLYQDASGLEQKQQLQQLQLEKEQLEYALERLSEGGGDSSRLSEQVLDAIVGLRVSVTTGDLTNLENQSMELKSLIYKRDYTFEEGEGDTASGIQTSLDSVNSQISALSAQSAQSTSRVTVSQSGIFSGQVDGYETILTPQLLDTVTPAQLEDFTGQAVQGQESAVGKLIIDSTWYFATVLDEAEGERLTEGRTATIRFSRDWSGEIKMTVERVGEPENGKVVVVLSSSKYLSETTLLRRQTVEIVFDTVTGVRVPNEAIRVKEETVTDPDTEESSTKLVTGVYALVGEQAEFKPVSILWEGDGFTLVEAAPSDQASQKRKALAAGDVIIVSAVDLYDGKVIE